MNFLNNISTFFFVLISFGLFAQNGKEIEDYIELSREVMSANPDSAFGLYCNAEKLAKSTAIGDYDGDIAYGKARYYVLMTLYGKASEEINKAIVFYEAKGDYEQLSSTYSLQSILLDRIGDIEAAHLTQLKACKIAQKSKNVNQYTYLLLNLVLDYLNPNDLDSAFYFLKELESNEVFIDGESKYYYYQNWGHYYLLKNDFENSISYSKKALDVANKYDMLDSKATIYKELSRAYMLNQQNDEAKTMANRSYRISDENNLIHEKSEALMQLIVIAKEDNEFQDAYLYQKELTDIEKEIFNVEKVKKAKEMEGQLHLIQKDKMIAEQQLSIHEEQLKANRVKSQNIFLYLVISIVSLLVFFTLWIYLKTKRLNISINQQKDIIQEKSDAVEEAYNNIHDSLEYSRYIQRAMLPSKDFFKSNFDDYFIYFQPKDIVSGDFYWAEEKNGKIYLAAVDCTGHGVPGAMVSVIGHNGLNRCLKELELKTPCQILNSLSDFVEDSLNNEEKEMKDGMDISLCSFDMNNNLMDYAGANNSIYVVSNGNLKEYKANKRPVGKYFKKQDFTEKQIKLNKGDVVYLFTDGYADQFGGKKGKKLKYKAFRDILLKNALEPMEKQKKIINEILENWRGDLERTDDVCVIGVRV